MPRLHDSDALNAIYEWHRRSLQRCHDCVGSYLEPPMFMEWC